MSNEELGAFLDLCYREGRSWRNTYKGLMMQEGLEVDKELIRDYNRVRRDKEKGKPFEKTKRYLEYRLDRLLGLFEEVDFIDLENI